MRLEARELLDLTGACRWPSVAVGRAIVRGAAGWRAALYGIRPAVAQERVVLLRGLEKPLLTSTKGGRARLRQWLDTRRAASDPPLSVAQRHEHIAEDALVFGDNTMFADVVAGLCRVPPFVAESVLNEVAFLTVGRGCPGWHANATLPTDRVVVQIADSTDVPRTVTHECAHAWCGDLPGERHPMVSVAGHARVMAVAREERWPAMAIAERDHALEECRAKALETIWCPR